jgi:hypothetical protein
VSSTAANLPEVDGASTKSDSTPSCVRNDLLDGQGTEKGKGDVVEEGVARTAHIWTRMHVWRGASMLIRATKESRAHECSKAQTKVSKWTVKCPQQRQNASLTPGQASFAISRHLALEAFEPVALQGESFTGLFDEQQFVGNGVSNAASTKMSQKVSLKLPTSSIVPLECFCVAQGTFGAFWPLRCACSHWCTGRMSLVQ